MTPKERQAAEIELLRLLEIEAREHNNRNEIYEAYRLFKGRYAVLIGGSGSGKSYEIADKNIDRIVQEDKHRILCCRAEQKQISESQVPLIVSRIKARYEESYNKNQWKINLSKGHESITYLPNGNQFIFWGLDDPEKLKSIFDITSIWIEEADQIEASAVRELDRRLRGYDKINKNGTKQYMQISFSFNPVSILSYLKKQYFDAKEPNQIMLHGEQGFPDCVYWRDYKHVDYNKTYKAYDEKLKKEVELYTYNTLVMHTTYLDNRFIDDNYSKILEKQKEIEPEEYNVYALGQWGITGGTYFDKANVNKRILANTKVLRRGYFEFDYENEKIVDTSIKWVDDPEGYIKIYEEPKPGYPYAGGGDTAGEGSDWNTGYFTNNVTKEDVAALRYKYDEDLYARQMYCLGKYYGELNNCNNNALLSIETKFSTHPVKELIRLGYHNQYVREEKPDAMTGKLRKIYGFDTNTATRPTALGMLRAEVREHPERIKDIDLLYEMTTFVKNEQGKPEAAKGEHDDCVMARAINCYTSHQQTAHVLQKVDDIDDDEDDYKGKNANSWFD